jgi:transcriptional accessory protein Tex/SPT6
MNVAMQRAKINTYVTEKGVQVAENSNQLEGFNRFRDKPIQTFGEDLYLRMLDSEKAGLINIKIVIPERDLTSALYSGYLNSNMDNSPWNRFRKDVIDEAVSNLMMPALIEKLRLKLHNDAIEWISKQCSLNLEKRLHVQVSIFLSHTYRLSF